MNNLILCYTMDTIKPNDIECREPVIIEIDREGTKCPTDDIACNRIKGVIESLAVGAIFTILGLLIWTVC